MESLSFSISITKSPEFLSSNLSPPKANLNNLLFNSLKRPLRKSRSICVINASNVAQTSNLSNDLDSSLDVEPDKCKIELELRKDTEDALEWRKVCLHIAQFASTAAGRATCHSEGLPVGRHVEESRRLLDQTNAAAALPETLELRAVEDLSAIVSAASAGQLLGTRELCTVERSLRAARGVFNQLEQLQSAAGEPSDRFSPLLDILRDCDFLTELAHAIDLCIDCTLNTVLDRASKKLESIRSDRRFNMEELESLLKAESLRLFQAGGIDSPLVTKRRARMCIGIKASHKSLLPEGVVLSVSSSGATYFMEPRAAVELNNREVMLSNSEKEEEIAILGLLTSEIANSEANIRNLMEKIKELDLACARGAYAVSIDGSYPVFSENDECNIESMLFVDIEGIQHPLLLEPWLSSTSSETKNSSIQLNKDDEGADSSRLSEADPPVPLDIKIERARKVVVISGPNTGGKTATMKTLGLAALMSKAGIFLPAKNRPRLPWFNQIFADIGDHQSLEHSLSTFSGHISRLCKIMNVVSKDSLVLIDEIGSGTDPSEGVALSTSILQNLADNVRLAIVTTHYADLSLLKAKDSRFENAAMEFCLESLRPTYRVLWGSTGNSNALSIAKTIGFDQKVLDTAQEWVQKMMPDKQKERQGLLFQSLLEEKNLLEAQANEAAFVLLEVKKLHFEIQSEAEDLDSRVASLKAKETYLMQEELRLVKSQMDTIIKDFENRLQSANIEQANAMMKQCEAAIASIVAAHCPVDDALFRKSDSNNSYLPQIGDRVYLKALGDKLATVVEEPSEDGRAMVQYGKIRLRVKKNDMKLSQRVVNKSTTKREVNTKGQEQQKLYKKEPLDANKGEFTSFGPVVQTSKNTVDLRGKRVEEAARHLQMAISASRPYSVLFVVHGMGTGAVKQRALALLKNHPRVSKFEEESPMNYGCTVAYIQ